MLGPTGVGKTKSMIKVSESLNLSPKRVNISIDDCVVNSEEYNTFFSEMIFRDKKLNNKEVFEKFSYPSQYYYKKIKDKYFEIRKKDCDLRFDAQLAQSLKDNKNVSLEMTGINDLGWIMDMYSNEIKSYDVYFVWTIADISKLIDRNIKRYQHNLHEFIYSKSKIAPRLTFNNTTSYLKILKRILINLKKDLEKDHPSNVHIIVVQNNKSPKIIYDKTINKCSECDILFKLL
jgi:Cdc6-like AAA superfamily ATPase